MAKNSFQDELEQRATQAILVRSIYRWESAVIIALTVGLAVLDLAGVIPSVLPFWQWWFWLVLGALGEAALVWSSIRDPEFRAKAVAEMFREKFDAREIRNKALRGRVEKALEYRDRIDEVITGGREGVLRAHLEDVSGDITDWMENVFRLARRLDVYIIDRAFWPFIEGSPLETYLDQKQTRQGSQPLEREIAELKRQLAVEDDATVKRQISQTIAQKQIQRDNLRKLQNVMERAHFQLESTITAMGTVLSQMMILSARDVGSGRAQRLQQDISDQVQALQDVVQTMDEVYQAGIDPLGAPGGAQQKQTGGN